MPLDPQPQILLYDWPVSPFCHKVRAVLEHKQLAYVRLPALGHRRTVMRRGGIGKVPALAIGDDFLVDSTDIVYEIERRFPAHPVTPAAQSDRARCHLLEDWADESLYFFGLYYHWHEPGGARAAAAYFGRSLLGKLSFPFLRRRINRQLWGQGLSRKTPTHVRADLERNLDAIEALLPDEGFLLGPEAPGCATTRSWRSSSTCPAPPR